MGDVDLGHQVSSGETGKEPIPPDPVPIISLWRNWIGTVQDGGVIHFHDPCDAGLGEDFQNLASLIPSICNNLGVDVCEVILGSDMTGEEEHNILESDGTQLLRTLGGSVLGVSPAVGSNMVWSGLASNLAWI